MKSHNLQYYFLDILKTVPFLVYIFLPFVVRLNVSSGLKLSEKFIFVECQASTLFSRKKTFVAVAKIQQKKKRFLVFFLHREHVLLSCPHRMQQLLVFY